MTYDQDNGPLTPDDQDSLVTWFLQTCQQHGLSLQDTIKLALIDTAHAAFMYTAEHGECAICYAMLGPSDGAQ